MPSNPIDPKLARALSGAFNTPKKQPVEPSLWSQIVGYFGNPVTGGQASAQDMVQPTPTPEPINPFANFANKATGRNFK